MCKDGYGCYMINDKGEFFYIDINLNIFKWLEKMKDKLCFYVEIIKLWVLMSVYFLC